MNHDGPFHEGERLAQSLAGLTGQAERTGRMIADHISEPARAFVAGQTLAVIASIDGGGRPWASLLTGKPGFLSASESSLDLDLEKAGPDPRDPLWRNLEGNPEVGVLIIDLVTRRRLRVNGSAAPLGGGRWRVAVRQAYPNCPKYIRRRALLPPVRPGDGGLASLRAGSCLDDPARRLIAGADTLFVASGHPTHGVDASHRGGLPGFVEVIDENTLRIPDYAGNGMLNTLGNLVVEPRAGLLFIDFERGRTLQLAGRAEVAWGEAAPPESRPDSAERSWRFHCDEWLDLELPAGARWAPLDFVPG